MYEKSYMHRTDITHHALTATNFYITASVDGVVKFWKKVPEGVEFVKTFLAHKSAVTALVVDALGHYCATIGDDRSVKVFDVLSFDMVHQHDLPYVPSSVCFTHSSQSPLPQLAIAERGTGVVHIYNISSDQPVASKCVHNTKGGVGVSVLTMSRHPVYPYIVSADNLGHIEHWVCQDTSVDGTGLFAHPHCTIDPMYTNNNNNSSSSATYVSFEFKGDTDLYECVKTKTRPTQLLFNPSGSLLVMVTFSNQIIFMNAKTGKILKRMDESVDYYTTHTNNNSKVVNDQPNIYHCSDVDYGKRLAIEKEIDRIKGKSDTPPTTMQVCFDASGNFLCIPTPFGVKVVNIHTNKVVRLLGLVESDRFTSVVLFQGRNVSSSGSAEAQMNVDLLSASHNVTANAAQLVDPTFFVLAYKRPRFYMFSTREPSDDSRDVYNEKLAKNTVTAGGTGAGSGYKNNKSVTLHTSMGDVKLELYPAVAPKTVHNFVSLAQNGYYNNTIFHRVIKSFMVQGGDPGGDGRGGQSIWGKEFEDEFSPLHKHDRPGVLSMANKGPNTNGSQFFITTTPCPHLNNKHTVFGHVVGGLDVVTAIENVQVNPKTSKPINAVKIVGVSVL